MRKAQKTVKRQIKINEKKEIKFIEKPTESELDALSLKTLLLSLEIVIGNHQKVWKNEKGKRWILKSLLQDTNWKM